MGVIGGLVAAGIGMQALGSFQQGQAASQQAKGQQAIAQYNAKVAQQDAKAIEQQTAVKQRQAAEEADRYASSVRAGLGASGVVMSEGTPLMIQAKQASESELNNLMIGYQGQIAKDQALSQNNIQSMQGDIYGQQAANSQVAGMFGAGTSLLGGFGQMAVDNKYRGYYMQPGSARTWF